MGSKRRIFSATVCVLAVQGHSRSSKVEDLGTVARGDFERFFDILLLKNFNSANAVIVKF